MPKWKDIKGYEGLYQVSDEGQVKRLERTIVNSRKQTRVLREQILVPKLNGGQGYYRIGLTNSEGQKFFSIHRLVGEAFIPNPENKPHINHKDENRANNKVQNLEWATASENMNHGTRNKQISEGKIGKRGKREVKQYKDGELINTFPSIKEASDKTGTNYASIQKVLRGERRGAGGFSWI